MIAEQNADFNRVEWISADPVTGSKQTVSKSGVAAAVLKAREEYEPLGQAVRINQPLQEPGSGGQIAPITNDAMFPEWQCLSRLAELPRHCSQAAEQEMWNGIDTSWEKKEGNLSQLVDAPLPQIYNGSSSNEMLAYALTATSKPDKKKKKKAQEVTADEPLAIVQSEPWRESPIESNNAEFGSFDVTLNGLTSKQVKMISEQLTYMANENCAEAFKAAGLATPEDVVNRGITIFFAELLQYPSNNDLLGFDNDYRKSMKKTSDSSLTVNDITSTPKTTYKGKFFMALKQRAFDETDGTFGEIFTHALMHAAGAEPSTTHRETVSTYSLSRTPGQRFPHAPLVKNTITKEVPNAAVAKRWRNRARRRTSSKRDKNTNLWDKPCERVRQSSISR